MSIVPLGNKSKVKLVLLIAVAVFLGGFFIKKCQGAERMDFVAGSAVVRGPAGAFGLNVCEVKAIANFADLCGGFLLVGDSTWQGAYSGYQAIVHGQVVAHTWGGFELGIGVAHLQHADAYNSGDIDFSLSLQRRVYKNFYLRYQHFSNAGTSSPNQGRDIIGGAWRW
jgi:hypothetical protein